MAKPKGGGTKPVRAKPKGKRNEPAATQAVKPSELRRMIPPKEFETLARRCKSLKNQVAETSGTMGELIKDAAEKKFLHRKAFSAFRSIAGMEDNKLAEFLAHFDYYRDIGGLDERAKNQAQMFARTEAGEGEEADGETAAKADTGTPPGEKDQRPRFAVHEGGPAAANGTG